MSQHRMLLEGTTVVLVVNGYCWTCPDCRAENYTLSSRMMIRCSGCSMPFRVLEVLHTSDAKPLLPGTHPEKIFDPNLGRFSKSDNEHKESAVRDTKGDICLIASGYSWCCPECDEINFTPGISFEDVICLHCMSKFEISEYRHRTGFGDLGSRIHPGANWLVEERIEENEYSIPKAKPSDTKSSFIGE